MIITGLSLDSTVEKDTYLEITSLCIELHEDHGQNLHLHLDDLSKLYDQMLLKRKLTLKTFNGERQF